MLGFTIRKGIAHIITKIHVQIKSTNELFSGESLNCYHCIKSWGEDCDDPTKNPAYTKKCPEDPNLGCVKRNISLSRGNY